MTWEKELAEAKKALAANKRMIEASPRPVSSGKPSGFKRKSAKPKGIAS